MPAAIQVVRFAPGAEPVAGPTGADTLWLIPTPTASSIPHPPQVVPIQAFADELLRVHDPVARPLTDSQRRLLLEAVFADVRDAGAPNETRGFADSADGLIRELKRAGVEPKRFARVGGDALSTAAAVFATYEKQRAKLGRLDPDDRLTRAAELWSAGRWEPFAAVKHVVVSGFTAFTEPELRMLRALAESVADIVVTMPDGDREELFAGARAAASAAERLPGEANLFTPPARPETQVRASPPSPAAGIAHLSRTLFGPNAPSPDAAGVQFIEAPGRVGEARLVGRAIRRLLAAGERPESVVVTARHPGRSADVLREVFDEYRVPCDWPEPPRLSRHPAVATLLRAWRLPDDDFPFAGVAALLRNTFFRPAWDAVRRDPELPLRSEALLRQLGVLRGKNAYLTAVETWCVSPPPPLEDEQAEEPRRKRLQRLAQRCRPFLRQFFRLWDRIPRTAAPDRFGDRLAAFANDIGLTATHIPSRFWDDLSAWVRADWREIATRKTVTKAAFTRMLGTLAAATPQAAPPPGGRVRVLPPEDARGAACDHLFVTGLGEGSFPDLSAPPSLLTPADRVRLRAAGLALADPDARLSAEMLLFLELVSRPRKTLTLSYPAVDEKGQPLLPSSFLLAARECFAPGAVPVTRQRMMIEGYATQEPMSDAELRVQVAQRMAKPGDGRSRVFHDATLSPDLIENLEAARAAADARFRDRGFGPFDGLLRTPAVIRDLAEKLGPAKVFSPTALEAYVACPFRFWVEHVLRLEPLDDPGDEVEHTRRGAAVHRALARFHAAEQQLAARLPGEFGPDLEKHLLAAVGEYAARAGSPATKVLWELEGRRLLRSLARYGGHWDEFRAPWREKGAAPAPHSFEADFGMPPEPDKPMPEPLVIAVGGVEVRVGGRIDRVDTAELADGVGFWIIDYKTGRGQYYTSTAIERFERLQLPLYAVAVERVLLPGKAARPLGLAYWMVTADGSKPVLPGKRKQLAWLTDPAAWAKFRGQLEAWVAALAGHIRTGDFPLAPRSEDCTDTCHFGPVCRISQARAVGKEWKVALPVVGGGAGD